MTDYLKFKEKSPQDTILFIQQILNRAGIFTVMERTGGEYEGANSNRVSIYPSKILGQNGKGTDELFATASGYAELMERLQNRALDYRILSQDVKNCGGFLEFPDEKILSIGEILSQQDSYLNNIFKTLNYILPLQKENLLATLAKNYYKKTDGTINAVPYVDVFGDRIIYLPFALITLFSLTNGMTAGNTLEEALVQGISEVFERYVNRKLIEGDYTPPEIPREYLKNYKLNDLIDQIESGGRYKISVRDCSMGKNFPVVATIITDKNNGTFGIKFGCHPSFAVSVERTLTEALQGKTIADFSSSNRIGTAEEVHEYHNILNIIKVGYGFFPQSILAGNPSWKFSYSNWQNWNSATNGEYLKKLVNHIKAQGFNLLIRDSSHLGFKSYHVLIPEIQSVLPVTEMRLREFWTQLKVAESLNHFPRLTEEEETRLLKFLKFKESSVEGSMGLLFLHYFFGDLMTTGKIMAYVSLKRGDYRTAVGNFKNLAESAKTPDEKIYFECLELFAKLMTQENAIQEVHATIKYLFPEKISQRVINETADTEKILERVFLQLNCFDCEKCSIAGKNCEYSIAAEIHKKIKTAMAKSTVSQQNLLENLKEVDF